MTQVDRTVWALPEQLRRARESVGLTLDEAAKLSHVQRGELEAWERGHGHPSDEHLWDLAETYGRPVAYFFALTTDPPQPQDYRATGVLAGEGLSPETRRLVVARFEELCRNQTMLERALGRERPALITAIREEARRFQNPRDLASFVRARLGLEEGPVGKLRETVEAAGVMTFALDLARGGPAGTSWWHPTFGPAMLVNRTDATSRQLFTIAHELAHLLMQQESVLCGNLDLHRPEEVDANAFAAELLMPEKNLREFAQPLVDMEELGGWGTSDKTLDKIARHYATSREATAWRLESLRLLPSGFTAARRPLWVSRPWARKGQRWRGALRYLGPTYVVLTRDAYNNGLISLSGMADMLDIDVGQADEWLSEEEGHRG